MYVRCTNACTIFSNKFTGICCHYSLPNCAHGIKSSRVCLLSFPLLYVQPHSQQWKSTYIYSNGNPHIYIQQWKSAYIYINGSPHIYIRQTGVPTPHSLHKCGPQIQSAHGNRSTQLLTTWLLGSFTNHPLFPRSSSCSPLSLTVNLVRKLLKPLFTHHAGYVQGWPESYICTIYERIFRNFPAKSTVYTPYIHGSGQPQLFVLPCHVAPETGLHFSSSRLLFCSCSKVIRYRLPSLL